MYSILYYLNGISHPLLLFFPSFFFSLSLLNSNSTIKTIRSIGSLSVYHQQNPKPSPSLISQSHQSNQIKENQKQKSKERKGRINKKRNMSASSTSFSPDQHLSPSDQLCYVHCNFCDTVLAVYHHHHHHTPLSYPFLSLPSLSPYLLLIPNIIP